MGQIDEFCSRPKYHLLNKLQNNCSVLQDKRYPESVTNISIIQKTTRVNFELKEGSKRCPV